MFYFLPQIQAKLLNSFNSAIDLYLLRALCKLLLQKDDVIMPGFKQARDVKYLYYVTRTNFAQYIMLHELKATVHADTYKPGLNNKGAVATTTPSPNLKLKTY